MNEKNYVVRHNVPADSIERVKALFFSSLFSSDKLSDAEQIVRRDSGGTPLVPAF